jgi:RNA polymerase sigma-70 factor (ECF subfamily)
MPPELSEVSRLLVFSSKESLERQRAIEAVSDLRRLYDEHADFVRRAVIRLGGPRSDVDDLVQDVFMVAMRKSASFEGRSTPRTWLYGIAIKVVAAARRRARVREIFGMRAEVDGEVSTTPADLFEHKEESTMLYALLDKIAEKKRTVLILYELEGLSGEQIAEVVGCPLKTVWTRLHHARRELAALVEKQKLREARVLGAQTGGR